MCSEFVRASELYDVESRTPIAHPAHQATDTDVQRALGDREVRADGGRFSTDSARKKNDEIWPDQSGSDHSWSQVVQTKFATASPSETYFATRSPSPSSQLGQRAIIRQLVTSHHGEISLRPQYIGWGNVDSCLFCVATFREKGKNSCQRVTSVRKRIAELVGNGAIHLSARKLLDPQEQAAVPMGRMLPFRSSFAAYADSQRTHTATTRLWSRKAITPCRCEQGAIFNSCEKYRVICHREIFAPACTHSTRANYEDGGSR